MALVLGPDSIVNNSHIFNNVTAVGYDANYYGAGLAVSGGNMLIENTTIANNQAISASLQGGGRVFNQLRRRHFSDPHQLNHFRQHCQL